MENTTVSVYAQIQDPLKFIQEFGMSLARSQMFGCSNPEQGQVMAMACMCEGISPIEISRKYHIIKGKLEMRADAMLAAFRGIGGKHRVIQRDSEAAEIELTIDGQTNRFRFTMEEAKRERFVYEKDGKTLKDNWATPRMQMQMLWARVASDGVRTVAPEVNAGMYTPEEVRDFPDDRVGGNGGSVASAMPIDPLSVGNQQFPVPSGVVGQPEGEGAVIDAEFQVLPDAAVPLESVAQASAAASPPAGKDDPNYIDPSGYAEVMSGEGFCTAAQSSAIRNLYVEKGVPYEAQERILRSRNVQSLRNLTTQQADEIIAKLQETKRVPKS